ncbi:MAG: type IX secretion system protein PorQ [Bacteroidetes bacterium]|nr:MAG: type IX secretion system protein PorQ [Bacteroidota bacterium]
MIILKQSIFIFLLALLTTIPLFAGGTYDFLRNDVGARAGALGGNMLTINDDPNILFYNPAGLATISSQKVSFGFFKHLLDINAGHASYATTIPSLGTVGAGLLYVNYGEFQMTGDEGQDLGTFSAGDLAMTFGYGGELPNGFQYGINAKFIFSSIAGNQSSAGAIDLGARYVVSPDGFVIGTSILNLGSQFDPYINTREDLPLDVRIGASIYPEHVPAIIMVGFTKLNEQNDDFFNRFSSFIVGVEFTASESVLLRFGYNNERRRELKIGTSTGLAGLSLGAGFRTDMYTIDYGFNSLGNVGGLHRVSLGFGF